MSDQNSTIVVGQFGGAFGVHGEVRLKSFCADPAAIADYTPLTTETGLTINQIVLTGRNKTGFTAKIDAVTSKEQADGLKGTKILARRDQLPSLPDDEFYYTDLTGLVAVDPGGGTLGTIASVQNHGASDLLELRLENGGASVLVPFTQTVVPTVDLAAQRVVIDPPEGLFPSLSGKADKNGD